MATVRTIVIGVAVAVVAGCFGPSVRAVRDFANVKVPQAAKRGQPVTVTATFVTGGCESDGRVYLEVDEATRTVRVTGDILTPYQSPIAPRACPTGIGYFDRASTFVPGQVGEYLVKAKVWPASSQGPYDHIEPALGPSPDTSSANFPIDATIRVQVTE